MAYFSNLFSGPILPTVLFGAFIYVLFIVTRFIINYQRMRKFYDNLPGYKPEQKHWLRGHLPLVSIIIF